MVQNQRSIWVWLFEIKLEDSYRDSIFLVESVKYKIEVFEYYFQRLEFFFSRKKYP